MNTPDLLHENRRRIALYFRDYNRLTGDPQGEVVPRIPFVYNGTTLYLPRSMARRPIYRQLQTLPPSVLITRYTGGCTPAQEKQFFEGFVRDRLRHDFKFWACLCVRIQDKLTKRPIPFCLNRGQRRLVAQFEKMRRDGTPIRVILVKARQWGGSTATQMYMLWLQLFHHENWHSAVVTQYKQQAANIRGMISRVIAAYPSEIHSVTLTGYEGMNGIKYIPQRGCIIGTGSAENPDALRSFDFAMLHLSEVGLWKSTLTKNADDLVQSLYATVPDVPGSFIVMESTAKGVGNFSTCNTRRRQTAIPTCGRYSSPGSRSKCMRLSNEAQTEKFYTLQTGCPYPACASPTNLLPHSPTTNAHSGKQAQPWRGLPGIAPTNMVKDTTISRCARNFPPLPAKPSRPIPRATTKTNTSWPAAPPATIRNSLATSADMPAPGHRPSATFAAQKTATGSWPCGKCPKRRQPKKPPTAIWLS